MLKKTLASPLDYKVINPLNSKGNQLWIFIGRTGAEAEAPVLWPPDAKSWLIGKDPDAGKDRRQKEKEVTEDEMVGWHRWLNDHELSKLREIMKDREAWHAANHGVTKSQTRLSNWTATTTLNHWSTLGLYYFAFSKISFKWSTAYDSSL